MKHTHIVTSQLSHLASLFEEFSAGCDPDFDAAFDDLEREFAEARLHFGNQ